MIKPIYPAQPITERGPHTITASAEDNMGYKAEKSISFTIYTSTNITLNIPSVEYSDTYTIRATLATGSQAVSGSAISVSGSAIAVSGGAISIKLNGTDLGTYHTDGEGNITLKGVTMLKAGDYTVEAVYQPNASEYYKSTKTEAVLTVLDEKSSIDYTKKYKLENPGKILVQATVSQEDDKNPGDLSLMSFRVEIIKINSDSSETSIEKFTTSCDTNGKIAFERDYGEGNYKVRIIPIKEGYYSPDNVNITILVQ